MDLQYKKRVSSERSNTKEEEDDIHQYRICVQLKWVEWLNISKKKFINYAVWKTLSDMLFRICNMICGCIILAVVLFCFANSM